MKGKVRNAFEGQRSDWNGEMHWHRQRLASASPIQPMTTTDKHIRLAYIVRALCSRSAHRANGWLIGLRYLGDGRKHHPCADRRIHVLRFSPSISSTHAIPNATSDSRTISYDRNATIHPFPTKDRVVRACRQCPSSSWSHLSRTS